MEFWFYSLLRGSLIAFLSIILVTYIAGYIYTLVVILKNIQASRKLTINSTFIYVSSIIFAFAFSFLWPKFAVRAWKQAKGEQ